MFFNSKDNHYGSYITCIACIIKGLSYDVYACLPYRAIVSYAYFCKDTSYFSECRKNARVFKFGFRCVVVLY